MIYQLTVTTPAATTAASPQTDIFQVTKGLIYQVEVEFPFGPLGLSGCAVFDGPHQCWPSTSGEWFSSNARLIRFDDLYLKEIEPFEFQVKTYNTDEEFSHKVYVRLGLVSAIVFKHRFMPHLGWEEFERIIQSLAPPRYVEPEEEFLEEESTAFPEEET